MITLVEYNFHIKKKRWTIKSASTGDEHLIMNGETCIAQLFKQMSFIYIDENLLNDYEEMKETITHELVHAFIMTYAISIKQFRDEEFICEFIAVYMDDIYKLVQDIMTTLLEQNTEKKK